MSIFYSLFSICLNKHNGFCVKIKSVMGWPTLTYAIHHTNEAQKIFAFSTNERRLIARCTRFWSELIGHRWAVLVCRLKEHVKPFATPNTVCAATWFVEDLKGFLVSVDRFCFAMFMLNYFHPWNKNRNRAREKEKEREMKIGRKATHQERDTTYIIYKYLIVYLELFEWFILFITAPNND